jgi:RsiW-degrading membrane proteinase PrsW (M82 family)
MENQLPRQCIIPIHKPSIRELAFFFASGILVSIPFAAFFESLFPSGLSSAFIIIVAAPFIEELAKVFPLFYRHGETERSIVTLGILMGLGFGIAEFFEYVVLIGVPPVVRIPGIVFHASSAAITSYGIAKKNPLPFYSIAVGLHVANNFFALTGDIYSVFAELLVLIAVYMLAYRYYQRSSKEVIVV